MTIYQKKLTEDDLKKIEEDGVYSMFTDAEIKGTGILFAEVADIRGEKYLRYAYGSGYIVEEQ